jgi:hypothetical protein
MTDDRLRRRIKTAQLTFIDALNDLPLQDVRIVLREASLGLARTAFAMNATIPADDPFADGETMVDGGWQVHSADV